MSTVYSIKDLENLTGIKAHTLRIWEKRYGIIKPKRTNTNIRYFLDADLKHVLNIALLNRNGIKISKIACMCENEISAAIKKISFLESTKEGNEIDAMILAILDLNLEKSKQILSNSIEKVGFEQSMYSFIYPLLDKLSVMWISGTIKAVHEAFFRNIIRNKVCSEIDNIAKPKVYKSSFLLFLPEGEDHELSVLFLQYLLLKKNAKVLNLGKNIAVYDVIQACEIFKPDYTFTIINDSFVEEPLQSYLDFMSKHIPNATLMFSGFQLVKQDVKLSSNCKFIENLNAVEKYI